MISDTERREVARRLREIRPCTIGYIKWWTIAKALDLKEPAGWLGWEKFEPDSVQRLADLIDPCDTSQGRRDAVACDREALLALADEMDGMARDSAYRLVGPALIWCAEQIREVLGVET